MTTRQLVAAALALALVVPARAVGGGCTATVSGAVAGTFGCAVEIREVSQGRVRFVFSPTRPVGSLKIFAAQIDVPRNELTGGGPKAVTTPVAALLVMSAQGATFVAGRGKAAHGELTVELDAAPKDPKQPHSDVVVRRGSIRARLVPAQGARGEVVVELRL